MLRTALISLIIGLLLTSSIFLFLDSAGRGSSRALGKSWDPGEMRVVAGHGAKSGGGLFLVLNQAGQGIVEVASKSEKLDELSVLHVTLNEGSAADGLMVAWRTKLSREKLLHYRVAAAPAGSLWLSMKDVPGWEGIATSIGLVFLGPPGARVEIRSVELLAPVFPYNAQALLSDWTDFAAWKLHSINAHPGVNSSGNSHYPVPFAAAVLVVSILVYLSGFFILRRKVNIELRVVAIMFLICWIALDMIWQARLLRQLDATREAFAGKTPSEKRVEGRDANLFGFISRVREEIGPGHPRVFVTSSNDYTGMRGAYFLYPLNVYWQRKPPSLPLAESITRGDFIVLLKPTQLFYDSPSSTIQYGDKSRLSVRRILSTPTGDLFQVI